MVFLLRLLMVVLGSRFAIQPGSYPHPPGTERPAAYCGYWHGAYKDGDRDYEWLDRRYPNGVLHITFKNHEPDGSVNYVNDWGTWWIEGGDVHVDVMTVTDRGEGVPVDTFYMNSYRTRSLSDNLHCYVLLDERAMEFCASRVDKDFEF